MWLGGGESRSCFSEKNIFTTRASEKTSKDPWQPCSSNCAFQYWYDLWRAGISEAGCFLWTHDSEGSSVYCHNNDEGNLFHSSEKFYFPPFIHLAGISVILTQTQNYRSRAIDRYKLGIFFFRMIYFPPKRIFTYFFGRCLRQIPVIDQVNPVRDWDGWKLSFISCKSICLFSIYHFSCLGYRTLQEFSLPSPPSLWDSLICQPHVFGFSTLGVFCSPLPLDRFFKIFCAAFSVLYRGHARLN